MNKRFFLTGALSFALLLSACAPSETPPAAGNARLEKEALLNVSYDLSRDFYKAYNPLFEQTFRTQNPDSAINIKQSHGGSSKQALSVANGLAADIVTMNQTSDIDLLVKKGLIKPDWRDRMPDQASPYTSNIVFLVRKGNPKNIRDWNDLAKKDINIVLANPKTSGNGRYAFLGAYGYGLKTGNQDELSAQNFVGTLLKNVPVFENGGRAATTTFTQRNIGDVLPTFENEAVYVSKKLTQNQFEIVYPSYTVLSEAPVAVVDSVVDKKGTRQAAEAYLRFLWSRPAQELAASLYLRPRDKAVADAHKADFPDLNTFDPNEIFGSWDDIMQKFFADGALFDQLNARH